MYRYSIVIKCMGRAVIEKEVGRGGGEVRAPKYGGVTSSSFKNGLSF